MKQKRTALQMRGCRAAQIITRKEKNSIKISNFCQKACSFLVDFIQLKTRRKKAFDSSCFHCTATVYSIIRY